MQKHPQNLECFQSLNFAFVDSLKKRLKKLVKLPKFSVKRFTIQKLLFLTLLEVIAV